MAFDVKLEASDGGAVYTFGKTRFADNIPSQFWIRDDAVLDISCGDEHSAIITASGRLLSLGSNEWGQLGLSSHNKPALKPTTVKALKTEKSVCIACGRSHTLVATDSGKVYAFGANADGQLGINDTKIVTEPVRVLGLPESQYKLLSAGAEHSIALTETGKLYVWGSGAAGQLGLGDSIKESLSATELKFSSAVIDASCGYYHTAVVTADGKLLIFGENENGKLGLKPNQLQKPTSVPQVVHGISEKICKVSCGGSHTAVLSVSGKVYVFGDGSYGQLGLGTKVLQSSLPVCVKDVIGDFKIDSVQCGENHTAVITASGQLYTCGDGRHGKLGVGLDSYSNLFYFNYLEKFGNMCVKQVACGGCHMLVVVLNRLKDNNEQNEPIVITNDTLTLPRDNNNVAARARRRQRGGILEPLNCNLPPLASAPSGDVDASSFVNAALPKLPDIKPQPNDDDEIVQTKESQRMKQAFNKVDVIRHVDSDVDSDCLSETSMFNKTHVADNNNVSALKPLDKGTGKETIAIIQTSSDQHSSEEIRNSEHEDDEEKSQENKQSINDQISSSKPVPEPEKIDGVALETSPKPDIKHASSLKKKKSAARRKSSTKSTGSNNVRFDDHIECKKDEKPEGEEHIQPTELEAENNNSKESKSKFGNFFNGLRRSFRKKKSGDVNSNTNARPESSATSSSASSERPSPQPSENTSATIDDPKSKKSTSHKKSKACTLL